MKNKLLTIFTAIFCLFGLSSCFENETTVTLKKDGSGTITVSTLFTKEAMDMMQMMALQGGGQGGAGKDPLAQLADEDKAKADAKNYGEGVEFVSLKKVEKGGRQGRHHHLQICRCEQTQPRCRSRNSRDWPRRRASQGSGERREDQSGI